ncbi:MAG: Nudix family hydrolase [Wenzhouxiangellaceae bacterium]
MIHGDKIEVSAAVLRDERGRVLLSRRLPGHHLAGMWEFPGGKIDPGESPEQALARELAEELDIRIGPCRPLVSVTHTYSEKTVRLRLFEVHSFEGTPRGVEGQAIEWVEPSAMAGLEMPAADRPLVRLLALDGYYSVSPSPGTFESDAAFVQAWRDSLAAGFRLLQLRLEPEQKVAEGLIDEITRMTRKAGARWIASGALEQCLDWPADGVHLDTRQLVSLQRRPVAADKLLLASCHDLEEIRMAEALEVDLVTLAPVQASHRKEIVPMGWGDFERLLAWSPLPVLARGGMKPDDWARARAAGAFGVAGMRSFGWN